jgi:hypothetical protein
VSVDAGPQDHGTDQRVGEEPESHVRPKVGIVPVVERRSVLDPSAQHDGTAEEIGQASDPAQIPDRAQQVVIAANLSEVVGAEP